MMLTKSVDARVAWHSEAGARTPWKIVAGTSRNPPTSAGTPVNMQRLGAVVNSSEQITRPPTRSVVITGRNRRWTFYSERHRGWTAQNGRGGYGIIFARYRITLYQVQLHLPCCRPRRGDSWDLHFQGARINVECPTAERRGTRNEDTILSFDDTEYLLGPALTLPPALSTPAMTIQGPTFESVPQCRLPKLQHKSERGCEKLETSASSHLPLV